MVPPSEECFLIALLLSVILVWLDVRRFRPRREADPAWVGWQEDARLAGPGPAADGTGPAPLSGDDAGEDDPTKPVTKGPICDGNSREHPRNLP